MNPATKGSDHQGQQQNGGEAAYARTVSPEAARPESLT